MKRKRKLMAAAICSLLALFTVNDLIYAADAPSIEGTTWRSQSGTGTYVFEKNGRLTFREQPSRVQEVQDGQGRWYQNGQMVDFAYKTRHHKQWYVRSYRFNGKLVGNSISGTMTHTHTWQGEQPSGPHSNQKVLLPVSKWPPTPPVKPCKPIVLGPPIQLPSSPASLSSAMSNVGQLPSVAALQRGVFRQMKDAYAKLESDRLATGGNKDLHLASRVKGAESAVQAIEIQYRSLSAKQPSLNELRSYREDYESFSKQLSRYNSTIRHPSNPPFCPRCGKRHISQQEYDEQTTIVDSESALLKQRASAFKQRAESYASEVKRYRSGYELLAASLKELLSDISRQQDQFLQRHFKPVEGWSLEALQGTLTQIDTNGKEAPVAPGEPLKRNVEYATKEDSALMMKSTDTLKLDDGKSARVDGEMEVAPKSRFKVALDKTGEFLDLLEGRIRQKVESFEIDGEKISKLAGKTKAQIKHILMRRFRVRISPDNTSSVRGTEVIYDVSPEGSTITVLEGWVETISSNGKSVTYILSGQQVLFKPDGTQVLTRIQPEEAIRQWRKTTPDLKAGDSTIPWCRFCGNRHQVNRNSSAEIRLIGKWKGTLEIDDAKISGKDKVTAVQAKAMLDAMKIELEFKSNGMAVGTTNILGKPQKQEGKWKVVNESGDNVTINCPSPDGKVEQMDITFDCKNAFVVNPPKGDNSMPAGVAFRFTRKNLPDLLRTPTTESLIGTRWAIVSKNKTIEFLADGKLRVVTGSDSMPQDETWDPVDADGTIRYCLNNKYSTYEGKIVSPGVMAGTAKNIRNNSWTWRAIQVD